MRNTGKKKRKSSDVHDSLGLKVDCKNLLKSAEKILVHNQELLAMCRRSALKHAALGGKDFEQDLTEIKLYLSKIEESKKRIENSKSLVSSLHECESIFSRKHP